MRMMAWLENGTRIAAMVAAAALAACSPVDAAQGTPATAPTEAAPARHPQSGLALTDVTVMRGERPITFTTELAITPEQQARGLMFRTELGDNEAMLFPYETPGSLGFWMKNTPITLDIIFIAPDRRILNIETATPYSLETVRSKGNANAVLEIRGGLASELGIVPGDIVAWELP
jgi:uncharacterized membrane protein (UPF0127 family)